MSESSTPRRPFSTQGAWRTYTPADGLAGLEVSQITQDLEGYLWFGTITAGVSRFDGESFRTFTTRDGLGDQQVHAVLCDRQGRVWCGTLRSGVCWYEAGAFHRFAEEAWVVPGHHPGQDW